MSHVDDDILKAQEIITYGNNRIKKIYHEASFMFLTSNEKIRCYQEFLKDRKRVLSVVASGDQILNTILMGSFTIDGFDISVFPKYLLELKRAAVLTLDLEQYKKFFFQDCFRDEEFMDDTYDLIQRNLDCDFKKFWDFLFNFNDYYDVFRSFLFSQQTIGSIRTIVDYNPYLDEKNYQKLKGLLGSVNLHYQDGDIRTLSKNLKQEYDLAYLSSILYYEKNYQEILDFLPVCDYGIILSYLYKIGPEWKEGYPNCSFYSFSDTDEGVMIYQKKLGNY